MLEVVQKRQRITRTYFRAVTRRWGWLRASTSQTCRSKPDFVAAIAMSAGLLFILSVGKVQRTEGEYDG